MSEPKRQHFLPEFYLEGFSRGGRLWVFDLERMALRAQTPTNTAVRRYYYSIQGTDGRRDNRIEQLLATVEGNAKPILDKLRRREGITKEQKAMLSLFVAFIDTRVPDFEEDFNAFQERMTRAWVSQIVATPEATRAVVEDYQTQTGEGGEMDPQAIFEFGRGEYTLEIPRQSSLAMMLQAAPRLGRIFSQMDWILLHCTENTSFITSDSPFIPVPRLTSPRRFYGVANQGVCKLLPLDRGMCLLMGDRGDLLSHHEMTREEVRAINLGIAANCQSLIIGRDEALVRSLARAVGLRPLIDPPPKDAPESRWACGCITSMSFGPSARKRFDFGMKSSTAFEGKR
jgi:hypothetical protein